MPRTNERARGFSLVELVLVLAIMVILAGIAVPRMNATMDRRRADAVAARILDDLDLASIRARSLSRDVSVVFDTVGLRYQVDGTHPFTGGNTYRVRLNAEPYNVSGMKTTGLTDSTLDFDPFGEPASSGTIILVVGSERREIGFGPGSDATMTRLTPGKTTD